jgi:Ca2+/Na+ antiporter
MDTESVVVLTIALGLIFLIIQRTETKKRRIVIYVMSIILLVVLWYVATIQIWGSAIVALLLALFLNYLFWLLIGRYNPVGSSDNIHVLGMDD